MAERPAIDLSGVIDTRLEQPPIWLAYPGGESFEVAIRPLGDRQQEFIEQAQKIEWDMATMARKVVVDQEQYLQRFCAWVIADWRGLTVKDLRRLILLRDPREARRMSGEVPCEPAAKLMLMHHSPAFSAWLNRVCLDIERFNQEREKQAEKKSLRPCVTGSTTPASTAGNAPGTTRRTASSRNVMTARSGNGTAIPGWPWPAIPRPVRVVALSWPGLRLLFPIFRSPRIGSRFSGSWCW